jgi:single-stranded-DNA-specific exonuclease
MVQILHNRGITEPDAVCDFLACRSSEDTDPFLLKGMPEAVARLRQAIAAGEPIAVYGDYDADGVTATALLTQTLTDLGAQVQPYIPNRFEEGYGLNKEALAHLVQQGVRLVVTVDCGIRSVEEVIHGNQLGLDMIITDHHFIGEETPPALAAINPKQPGCRYPFKKLAGVGLAFKLAQALVQDVPAGDARQPLPATEDLLDLVALGTVADLAPLTGENRSLVAAAWNISTNPAGPGCRCSWPRPRSSPAGWTP